MLTVAHFIKRLEQDVAQCHADITAYAMLVNENPANASNIHKVVRSAGVVLIANAALTDMNNGCSLADQLAFLNRQLSWHNKTATRTTDVQAESIIYMAQLVDLLDR